MCELLTPHAYMEVVGSYFQWGGETLKLYGLDMDNMLALFAEWRVRSVHAAGLTLQLM